MLSICQNSMGSISNVLVAKVLKAMDDEKGWAHSPMFEKTIVCQVELR